MTDIETNTQVSDAIREAEKLKAEGNAFFKSGNYQKALGKYTRVFAYINGLVLPDHLKQMSDMTGQSRGAGNEPGDEQKSQIDELSISCNSNAALAAFKMGKYQQSVDFCDKALAIDQSHSKALFRRAEARVAMGDLESAREDVAVLKECGDAKILAALGSIEKKIEARAKKDDQKMRKRWAGMFDKQTTLESDPKIEVIDP
eukprot:124367_1